MNILLLGLPVLLVITYLSSQDRRRAVVIALVLVVLEGALRKWILPQASQLLYFLKDFVLLGAYLSYLFPSKTAPKVPFRIVRSSVAIALLGLNLFWMIPQAFNPSLGSPIIGILGLKNYFFYIPLMWILPDLIQTEEELYQFLRHYLLLLIPVGLLAIAQFFAPPDSPLNVYAWGEEGPGVVLSGGGTSVRVTGTFSYIAGYSIYLATCLSLVLPMLSLKQLRLWRRATLAQILLIAITSFMTGARGLIVTAILLLLGYVAIDGVASCRNIIQTLRQLLIPTLLSAVLVMWRFRDAFDSFALRVTSNSDISGRISGSFLEPFTFLHLKGLDGYGVGATFQATPLIRALLRLPHGEYIPVFYEAEMGRVTLEIGIIGFFLWYGLRLWLLWMSWQTYRRLNRPFLRRLALSVFLLQSINLSAQIVFNHSANLYYWFLNGFILLLPQLEYVATMKQAQYTQNHSTPHASIHLPHPSHQ